MGNVINHYWYIILKFYSKKTSYIKILFFNSKQAKN